jgi:hypothetical protein
MAARSWLRSLTSDVIGKPQTDGSTTSESRSRRFYDGGSCRARVSAMQTGSCPLARHKKSQAAEQAPQRLWPWNALLLALIAARDPAANSHPATESPDCDVLSLSDARCGRAPPPDRQKLSVASWVSGGESIRFTYQAPLVPRDVPFSAARLMRARQTISSGKTHEQETRTMSRLRRAHRRTPSRGLRH